MLSIKVLGPGCERCVEVAQIAQMAVNTLNVEAQVEKVSDVLEIVKFRILATPGLVINERVVCAGRIPSIAEVTTWVANAQT
jgi:small redox-active disulfide protein 2